MPVVRAKRPIKLKKVFGIGEFFKNRNKVLLQRSYGGLGDILMHRMLFEDFKKIMPEVELHFACPKHYHDVVKDHPFLDQVLDSNTVDQQQYLVYYNTTKVCVQYETRIAPLADKHRSDIWATHCGLELTNHEMHIRLTESEKAEGHRIIEEYRDRPGKSVVIAPISSMQNKNMLDHHVLGLVNYLRDKGYFVFGIHQGALGLFIKNDIPLISGPKLRQWLGIMNQVDYTISVDTAHFHAAGGMKKPVVGVFTYVDGLVYSRYYPTAIIAQLHRATHPHWTCGPCYNFRACPKCHENPKPCLTELTLEMILEKVDLMLNTQLDYATNCQASQHSN
jgi:ADP-heptose:LPS heptosyltransferase